jgi:hypothetical protein
VDKLAYLLNPVDDFKETSIIPTIYEILDLNYDPKIRKMPKKGNLRNNHNYFDIIFRMLREDAVKPIRDGI